MLLMLAWNIFRNEFRRIAALLQKRSAFLYVLFLFSASVLVIYESVHCLSVRNFRFRLQGVRCPKYSSGDKAPVEEDELGSFAYDVTKDSSVQTFAIPTDKAWPLN